MKSDCNPKYTIPYVKVCDNVYLTKWFISSFPKAHALPSHQFCLLFSGGWANHQSSKCFTHSPIAHNTAVLILQSYAFASIFLQVLTVLGWGREGIPYWTARKLFLRENTFTFTIYLAQHTTESSAFKFQVFLPVIFTAIGMWNRTLCCTWTIHKGYYIVLHSFPISHIILTHPMSRHFSSPKLFSALVFKNIMGGCLTTWDFHSWVLKKLPIII